MGCSVFPPGTKGEAVTLSPVFDSPPSFLSVGSLEASCFSVWLVCWLVDGTRGCTFCCSSVEVGEKAAAAVMFWLSLDPVGWSVSALGFDGPGGVALEASSLRRSLSCSKICCCCSCCCCCICLCCCCNLT